MRSSAPRLYAAPASTTRPVVVGGARPRDNERRFYKVEAAVASSKTPATGGDLDKLRAQFEAARKARDQEATRLREEAQSARSLAATKADEAAEERKHATTARDDAAQALQKADKAEARSKRVDERRRAAEAACGAALAERDSLHLVLQSREATASSSRRRLDAAAQDADQQAALGRLLRALRGRGRSRHRRED